ncbi:MAG TPA: glycosyltransferase WbuB, partial [Patescibacteria group bacterium]|nr:glycosyltransferase WbuB [Patescibacteria group bacterium]
ERAGCGLVAAPGDARALSQAVAALAADPERARDMGQKGRDHVFEHYNRQKLAERLRSLLAETASQAR